jgi:hypothetical protein
MSNDKNIFNAPLVNAVTADIVPGDLLLPAFKAQEARIRAVPEADLIPVTLDPSHAAITVISAWPRFLILRPRVAKIVAEVNVELIDNAEQVAFAMLYINGAFVGEGEGESVRELHEEGLKTRELLRDTQEMLIKHGVVKGHPQQPLRGAAGYRNVPYDLISHVRFFRENRAEVEGKSPVTLEVVDRAAVLASRLIRAVSHRQGTPEEQAASGLLRQQGFTLLMLSYDQMRRVTKFLRWTEGDADEITPSPHAGRGGGAQGREEPVLPPPSPATLPAPITAAAAAAQEDEIPVGRFGSNPFSS